jgi:hypothetical protein
MDETRIVSLLGLAMLLLAGSGSGNAEPKETRVLLAQLTIRQRVILKVPAKPAPLVTRWKEKKGPKCLGLGGLAGAAVIERDSVDMILKGGQRMRAQFEDECPALGYYSGFYILPTDDGQICARRDAIRTRAGGECMIKRFRMLVPDR